MTRTGLVTVLGAVLSGCVGSEASEVADEKALLLMDQAAREGGFSLQGAAGSSALPRAVEPGSLVLDAPDGPRRLEVSAGEMLLVTGTEGVVERLALGRDVDPDRIVVDAPEGVVLALADETGAETVRRPDGRIEVSAPDVLAFTATLGELDDVAEVSVVRIAGRSARIEAPRVRSTTRSGPQHRPAASARTVGATPVLAAPVLPGPSAVELAQLRAVAEASGVSCADPVAGTWISQRHFPGNADWYVFTLKVGHAAGDRAALEGEMLAHSWTGGADRRAPLSCEPGGAEWVVRMPAHGRIADGQVRFEGKTWSVDQEMCGWAPGPGSYNLDRFSGSLTPDATGTMTLANDDGGRMRGEPFKFRRVSCR